VISGTDSPHRGIEIPHPKPELDQLSVNTIRFLAIDAIEKANSGHPGLPMGAAPMAYVLWTRFLKHDPANPSWFDRDRFILSAGHGSMLLYSLLYLTGYDVPLEQIKQFRQWGSITAGHPERGLAPGVETTTGPLGQGFGNGVGMAIAEHYLAARYNRPGFEIINHCTYAIVSDGDMMEGVSSEAASLAGDLKLGKLIYLYDNNHVSLSAATKITFTEDVARRFEAYGWHTQSVDDGNNLDAIEEALRAAKRQLERPSLILVHTHLGYGSPNKQDTFAAHGSPLGEEEVKLTRQNLGWPLEPPFYVPDEALANFRSALDRGRQAEEAWNAAVNAYGQAHPDLAHELQGLMRGELPAGWDSDIPTFPADAKGLATRVAGGKVQTAIAHRLPAMIGGSADLDPSTHTGLAGMGDFEFPLPAADETEGSAGGGWSYAGRNIHFGVREHGMGALLNGLAAHGGLIPFGATFLIFSDYMRPPIRLAALMGLQVIYVFTHDSIALGEDGPTHQPVEQLIGLRAVPHLVVIRPADANEAAEAWRVAIETRDRPVALVLTRQSVPTLDRTRYASAQGLRRGAYLLSEAPGGKPDLILIASGSEVALALAAQQKLLEQSAHVRVVSMPSWELFDIQPQEYRDAVLPPAIRARLAVEAGSPLGWRNYVGDGGAVIGVDHFGASAPGEVVMDKYGFNVANVCRHALALLGNGAEAQ
jgi:transketolase